ncbi:MAG: hypothetical protein RLZZ262_72 [Bacteroidota bacterium]|jgi:phage shock protein C
MALFRNVAERGIYGVCTRIADYMGVRKRNVRLSFIYLSFLTFGSPILVYLVLHFWRSNTRIWKPWKWGRWSH